MAARCPASTWPGARCGPRRRRHALTAAARRRKRSRGSSARCAATGSSQWGLGAASGALVTERAWELPAAGATLRERWAAIAPELAGHVAAVSYDADSGRLTVCPESAAWATD
ncbi:DciA family protein [Streptomyces sp. NPDC047046]|uniref:DciA family protein n=1 Tax=Streptomyces sp. NPDC047046 TaxID=3155378 RepID=UPI0033EBE0FD